MRNVLIVGAGQSGLMLALWLRAQGYDVTVATDRSAADVAGGQVMSTQVMFGPSLELERRAGLDFWQAEAPPVRTVEFSLVDPGGQQLVAWSGRLAQPARSVDQRGKFARWMRLFQDRGGHLEIGPISVRGVDRLCRSGRYDLVVVAAASSPVAELFPVDQQKSAGGTAPRRSLSVLYLHGVTPAEGRGQYVGVPGYGEIILVPALTNGTACHIMLLEAVPGGPWDVFGAVAGDPEAHLRGMLAVLARVAPALYDRCRRAVLTDPGGRLVGAVPPVVREPVVALPSGRMVVGMGDTVCRMDPLGAQGANTAARSAMRFGAAIVARGDRPFDREWMTGVAGECWDSYAGPAVAWTELLLDPPPAVRQLMAAAAEDDGLADRLVSAFADPVVATTLAAPAAG